MDGQTIGLIIGLVLGAIALGVLIFLFVKFVVIRNGYKKQVRDLERKYSYLDALLIGQDSQFVKRLEIISRTNLLYTNTYNDFSKRFKSIYDVDDKYAEGVLKQLNQLIKSGQYKNIKKVIAEGKKVMASFEKKATELDTELRKIIKPEEDARVHILRLKEQFRAAKQTYIASQSELESVSTSFDTIFSKLEKKFVEFEACIESAKYDEAKVIIPIISRVIVEVNKVLETMPDINVLVNHVIPEKIEGLIKEEESLIEKGYPLHHLMVNEAIKDYNYRIEIMKERLQDLKIDGINEECAKIQEDIENILNLFQKEISAKEYFDNNLQLIYSNVLALEKTFLRLKSLLPEMDRIYEIAPEERERIETLTKNVNDLGNAKRMLDTFIHSSTKQPYTMLASKLEELKQNFEKSQEGVEAFKSFLEGLKVTSEDAYTMVFSYYHRTKRIEALIRKIGIPEYTKKYDEVVERCYELLDEIDIKIKVTPIDVHLIEEKVAELKKISDELDEAVKKDANVESLAESAIIYANRDRNHQNDVHQALQIYEEEFFQGEFAKCYHDVVELLRRQHVDESGN